MEELTTMPQQSDADRDKKRLKHARSTFDSAYSDIILRVSANVTKLSIVIFTSMHNVPIITQFSDIESSVYFNGVSTQAFLLYQGSGRGRILAQQILFSY